ncbi:hypothetical protein BDQ17DRAFT_1349581 [Cyathus striatus]|nr:hypothetical protein BDQ17DRAFT_1349581 [Cyathus striatus]
MLCCAGDSPLSPPISTFRPPSSPLSNRTNPPSLLTIGIQKPTIRRPMGRCVGWGRRHWIRCSERPGRR